MLRFLGLDLAACPARPTGYAVLDERGHLLGAGLVRTDGEILELCREVAPALVGIDAPLVPAPPGGAGCETSLPAMRPCDRQLAGLGGRPLPLGFLAPLARRAAGLHERLAGLGFAVREVHPRSSKLLLGISCADPRSAPEEVRLSCARFVPNLGDWWAYMTGDVLDAVVAALTVREEAAGRARRLGHPDEGLVTVPRSRCIRAVVFDLDGTLTPVASIWQYIHEALGTWESHGARYLAKYLAGEIDYRTFALLDAGTWAGRRREELLALANGIPLRPGAVEVARELRARGVRLAILSSGLDLLAARVARDLGCAVWVANGLGTRDGRLDGRVHIRVGWHDKPARLPALCRKLGVRPCEVAVVGDGVGDALVFDRVGLAVAFNPAEEEVARRADVVVRAEDLRAVLPVLLEHLAP